MNGPPPFVDLLETLLAALAARGLAYRVAAVVNNITLTFRFDLFQSRQEEVIEVLDRDVILARSDVPTTVAAFPCAERRIRTTHLPMAATTRCSYP